MYRNRMPPVERSAQHTAVISDHGGMWSKLVWDVEVFRDIQVSYPDESEPLAYAAINVCIAAWSLREWIRNLRKRENRGYNETEFLANLMSAVPEQAACEAIANTAKHSIFKDMMWAGGAVRLSWYEGDEDVPSGYTLYHHDGNGRDGEFAVERFRGLCDNWWSYLTEHKLTNGQRRIPDWQQRKLKSIFGERPGQVPG